jgi:4-diphosphocytidyl-2-C-methyl-D-erythritol kinase
MNYIEIKAPAKINIGLDILSKRDDGYHNISTLFYPINDLHDILTFEPSDQFEFHCNSELIPLDSSNLVVKAKNLLERVTKSKIDVKITLIKNIPSQAGLGGGSSDAAATLLSLNEMFNLGLEYVQLIDLALQLGSDVPFFIKAKPAIGTSRGEILKHVELEIKEPILIINPHINISTKEAFNNISPSKQIFNYNAAIIKSGLNYSELKHNLKNDFEEYVFEKYSEIAEIKTLLYNKGALFSLMSGSGSTVYGIFPDLVKAEYAIKSLPKEYFIFLSSQES